MILPINPVTTLFGYLISYRFIVRIDGIPYMGFNEIALPNVTIETLPVTEGGQNTYIHQLPVRAKQGNVTLKRGMIGYPDTLYSWMKPVTKGAIDDAMSDIDITMTNVMRIPVITWSFRKAYPIRWSGGNARAGDSVVAIEELELVHHGFTVSLV